MDATRVTRNALGPNLSRAFRYKGSSKIMVSQIHLSFFISLTKNGNMKDMDPIKHIRKFFAKTVNGLIPFY